MESSIGFIGSTNVSASDLVSVSGTSSVEKEYQAKIEEIKEMSQNSPDGMVAIFYDLYRKIERLESQVNELKRQTAGSPVMTPVPGIYGAYQCYNVATSSQTMYL